MLLPGSPLITWMHIILDKKTWISSNDCLRAASFLQLGHQSKYPADAADRWKDQTSTCRRSQRPDRKVISLFSISVELFVVVDADRRRESDSWRRRRRNRRPQFHPQARASQVGFLARTRCCQDERWLSG